MQSSVSTKKVLVVAGIAAVVALICLLRARSRAAAERVMNPLLLDARLVRTVREPSQLSGEGKVLMTQTVAHVRFLAREGVPTGVFLPAGRRGGCVLTFVPRFDEGFGAFTMYAMSTWERMWKPDEFRLTLFKEDPRDNAPHGNFGYKGSSRSAAAGEYATISNWAAGCRDGEVSYEAQIRCERRVLRERIRHISSSLCQLETGEELHELSAAIPSIMDAGVKLEDPVPVPAASERNDGQ